MVRKEVEYLTEHYPKGRVVTLTVTLPEKGNLERSECEKRFHSLQTHLLSKLFCRGVVVFERSRSGRPHYHIAAALRAKVDVSEGFDWEAYDSALEAENTYRGERTKGNWARMMNARKAYGRSASPVLRRLWKQDFSRDTMAKYRFGIAHITPVRNGKAAATYYAKYLTKEQPYDPRFADEDKGKRCYRVFGEGHRACNLNHQPVTKSSFKWRRKLEFAANELGFSEYGELQKWCGARWFFHLGDAIQDLKYSSIVGYCELVSSDVLEHPTVLKWPWVIEMKEDIDRLHRCYFAMFDERDRDIPPPNEHGFVAPMANGEKSCSLNFHSSETQGVFALGSKDVPIYKPTV